MEKKFTTEFKVGVFVLLGILALFVLIFRLQENAHIKGFELKVEFDYVAGLEIGSPVRVSGVRVGEVKDIEILYGKEPKVLVTLRLKPDIKLGKHTRVTIQTLGIIGERYIEISPSYEKDLLCSGEVIKGIEPFPAEKFVSVGEDVLRNLNKVLIDIQSIVGKKDIQKNVNEIIANLNTATSNLGTFLEKINKISSTLSALEDTNKVIKETIISTKPKLDSTLIEIKTFFENLQNKGLISKILKEEKLFDDIKKELIQIQETTDEIKKSAEKFNSISSNLDSIISDVKKGKGSVGKFLTSDELYNEVVGFVKDIRANPWKLFIRKK